MQRANWTQILCITAFFDLSLLYIYYSVFLVISSTREFLMYTRMNKCAALNNYNVSNMLNKMH